MLVSYLTPYRKLSLAGFLRISIAATSPLLDELSTSVDSKQSTSRVIERQSHDLQPCLNIHVFPKPMREMHRKVRLNLEVVRYRNPPVNRSLSVSHVVESSTGH